MAARDEAHRAVCEPAAETQCLATIELTAENFDSTVSGAGLVLAGFRAA